MTLATTTLRTPSTPVAVAMNCPAFAGLPADATGTTVKLNPGSGAKGCAPVPPNTAAHWFTTSFWKLTTPTAFTFWSAMEIPDSAPKCTCCAPRQLRVARRSALVPSSVPAVTSARVSSTKSTSTSAKPPERRQRRRFGGCMERLLSEVRQRAVADRDHGLGHGVERLRRARAGARQARLDRHLDLRHAVPLRRGELRRGSPGHELNRGVAAVEVEEGERVLDRRVDEHDRHARRGVGAAHLGAEDVVGHVLARREQQAIAVEILLEAHGGGRRRDDTLLHPRAGGAGRRRKRRPRRVVARHAQLPAHEVDHGASHGLARAVDVLHALRLLLRRKEPEDRAEDEKTRERADERVEERAPALATGAHEHGTVLQRTYAARVTVWARLSVHATVTVTVLSP